MQIHEITEGILKGVTNAVTSPIKGIYNTGKNAAKFAGQAVTRPGMDYFADKILNAAGIPYDPLIRGANADELAAAADIKAAADKAEKEAAKKAGATAPTDTTPDATGTPPAATTNTTSPTTTNVPPGFNYNNVMKLPGVSSTTAPAATTNTAPATTTNVPPGFNYNNVTKLPGVNTPKTAPATAPVTPAPVATPQQSKIGVGQINKIIPSLRTRDLMSVKKNVDNTLAVKQKQPEPAATAAKSKPQWTGRQKNLTKQQKDYINAIQRNAK